MAGRAGSIVLWGAPLSGKTTYLLSLVFWQEHHEDNERYRRLCLLPANASTADWIAAKARTFASGEPLPKTSTVERLEFRLYDLPARRPRFFQRRPPPSSHIADLTFWDAPGEFFSGPIPDELRPELVHARGLILVVNPLQPPSTHGHSSPYWDFFDGALRSVQQAMISARDGGAAVPGFDDASRRIRYPVAICLSQADRAANPERDPNEWLGELLGRDQRLLTEWLANQSAFSFSAIGGDRATAGRGDPRPKYVMHPIRWILRESERLGL